MTAVLDDFKAMADEIEQLRDALTALFDLCTVHAIPGAFANGVTDPTGTIDEGEVHASGVFDQARAALNIHKSPE